VIADCGLQIADCGLQISDWIFGLQVLHLAFAGLVRAKIAGGWIPPSFRIVGLLLAT
jgi:hypothetical protein